MGQEGRLLGGADVALGAGMELDGRQVHFQQAHVLDDQRIHPGFMHLPGHAAGRFQFVVAQDGVERDEDLAAIAVGMAHQSLDVLDRVARRRPRTKTGPADVDRIRPVVHGLDADLGIAGRRAVRAGGCGRAGSWAGMVAGRTGPSGEGTHASIP
jgi:hypothetical protein